MPSYGYTYAPIGLLEVETDPGLIPSASGFAYSYTPTIEETPALGEPRDAIPAIGDPGGGYSFAEKVDYCDTAKDLLIKMLSESPRLHNLICTYVSDSQDLERAIWDLLDQLNPDLASGIWLDYRGATLKQSRNGLTDADYRSIIEAKTLAWLSSGTAEDLIGILRALIPGAIGIDVTRYNPGNIVLKLSDPVSLDEDVMFDLLKSAKAAGFHLTFQFKPQITADTFRYSTTPGGTIGSARGYGTGGFIGSRNS